MPFDVYSQAGADAKFLTEVDGGNPDAAPLPITLRRGTTAERDASNPILAAGEPAVVLDSGQPAELVLGDGVTAMADLRRAAWGDDTRLALAGTATQPGDLGTAAAADASDFASAAQGAKADAANAAVVPLPAATGTDDTTAIQAILTANPGKRIAGRPGSSYRISAPLVIASGTTLDMTGCTVTLIAGSNCRMIQNAALSGSGARDVDITIRGGYWDRGGNGGATSNDTHSIVLHRADRVSVTDIRFTATGACKYSIYLCDVTQANVARCDITSTSDGVHITGPASDITVRDIAGATDDDLVSFTGRDYTSYELTAGGGNITDIVVERVTHRGGDGNTVKLLPGAAMTLSGAVVRDVSGTPDLDAVIILSDTVQPSTTGGTVSGVVIDGVTGSPLTGMLVYVAHPDVKALTVRNLCVTKAAQTRVISINTSGTRVYDLVVDGVTSTVAHDGNVLHLGSGVTVDRFTLTNVSITKTANGHLLSLSGAIGQLQSSNLRQVAGSGLFYFDATSTCPNTTVAGLHCTSASACVQVYANAPFELHMSAVTGTPTNGRLVGNYSTSGTVVLRGSQITGTATTHLHRNAAQSVRAVGVDVRADVSTLTPAAGDVVTNTNAALACGVGPVISNGTLWKHLYTGATT